MIDLTPLEVRQKKGDFRRAMRGYDPELVNDFLDLVADRLEELVKENLALRDAAGAVQDELTAYRHKEQALSEALMSAQKLREEARGHAEREGDLVLREARLAAESLRQEALRQTVREEEALRQVQARRVQLVESFRQLLERQMRELDAIQQTLELPTGAPASGRARPTAPAVPEEPRAPDIARAGESPVPTEPTQSSASPEPPEPLEPLEPPEPPEPHVPEAGSPAPPESGAMPGATVMPEEPPVPVPDLPERTPAGEDEEVESQPLNLEWPVEEMVAAEEPREKRTPPEGFEGADEGDEEPDDWLSSLMEE